MPKDLSRRPTASNMEPTWGKHGVQEKRQDRSQGSKNLVLRVSEARIAVIFEHGPKMDPKWNPKPTPHFFDPQIDSQIAFRWAIHRLPNQLQRHSQIRYQIKLFTTVYQKGLAAEGEALRINKSASPAGGAAWSKRRVVIVMGWVVNW